MSAPARRMHVRDSIMARSWSSHPLRAAASIMENSPLTGTPRWARRSAGGLIDQVEVGHGGFTMIMSGPLRGRVRFPHGLAPVGRVHLVAAPVAELRGRFGRLAERPVEYRGDLAAKRGWGSGVAIGVERLRMAATRPSIMSRALPYRLPRGRAKAPFGQPVERDVVCPRRHPRPCRNGRGWCTRKLHTSVIASRPGTSFLMARRRLHDAVVGVRPRSQLVLALRQPEQDHAADAQDLTSAHSRTVSSMDIWAFPGMARSGGDALTGQTNKGSTKWTARGSSPAPAADRFGGAQAPHADGWERHMDTIVSPRSFPEMAAARS